MTMVEIQKEGSPPGQRTKKRQGRPSLFFLWLILSLVWTLVHVRILRYSVQNCEKQPNSPLSFGSSQEDGTEKQQLKQQQQELDKDNNNNNNNKKPFRCRAPTATHHAGTVGINTRKQNSTETVAFLFLTHGEEMVTTLWERWFPEPDDTRYSIWVHTVETVNQNLTEVPVSSYFCPHVIPSVRSRYWWMHHPMMQLLQYSYDYSMATHFVFVSATSVPLQPFDRVYNQIMEDPSQSRLCLGLTRHVQSSWNATYRQLGLKPQHLSKASQWSTLSRAHTALLLRHADEMQRWNRMFYAHVRRSKHTGLGAPDELFIPTMLRKQLTDHEYQQQLSSCHGPVGSSSLVEEGQWSGCCSHYVQWNHPRPNEISVAPGCVAQRGVGGPPERPCAFNLLKIRGIRKVAPQHWFLRKVLPYAQLVLETETRIPIDEGLPNFVWIEQQQQQQRQQHKLQEQQDQKLHQQQQP